VLTYYLKSKTLINLYTYCRNPTLRECEDETHIPKMGTWESSGTPKTSEFDCKGKNTLHWDIIYIIGKLLKCRCRKWACMSHLDICSTSYGKKKGRESNWQFDSQPLKVGNRPNPDACRGGGEWDTPLESSRQELQLCFRPHPNRRSEQKVIVSQSWGSPNRGSFEIPPWEYWDKKPFRCGCHGEAQRIL